MRSTSFNVVVNAHLLESAKLLGLGCVHCRWVRGWRVEVGVAIAADRAIDAKPQLVHIAFLCAGHCVQAERAQPDTYRYFANVVLVWAVGLSALASACKGAAHRHAAGVELVQEAACVALHA